MKCKVKRIKCDFCGCFISYKDLDEGKAISHMIIPDSYLTKEEYETICSKCRNK